MLSDDTEQTPRGAADIAAAAQRLDRARRERTPIVTLTARWPGLSESDAYAIQAAGNVLAAGTPAGFKLGYTTAAMRRQMNVDEPNFGRLRAQTQIGDGERLDLENLIHPLLEPEIAIRVARDLTPDDLAAGRLERAIDAVFPALEIVDTRYVDYTFKAADNIADNSSAARYVLGPPQALAHAGDLAATAATLLVDGNAVASGRGSDALGHPLNALAWLIEVLARSNETLSAGAIVLTGGLTRAHPIAAPSAFRATFTGLGSVTLETA